MYSVRSITLAWTAVAQSDCNIPILNLALPLYTLQNTSHVYDGSIRYFHHKKLNNALIYTEHSVTLIYAQDINMHKHIHMQNNSHVYSDLAASILCPILLKHYCTIKYIVVNQIKNANK